ncbi:MAG: serine protease [Bacteroidota bacterium]|jgi:S1-C subfamily serine protease
MKTIYTTFFILVTTCLFAQPFTHKYEWEEYFKKNINSLDPIEGIWSHSFNAKYLSNTKELLRGIYNSQVCDMAIYKNKNGYNIYAIDRDNSNLIRTLKKTANKSLFLWEMIYTGEPKSIDKSTATLINNNVIKYSYLETIDERIREINYNAFFIFYEVEQLKIYPTYQDFKQFEPSSGTGFAISSNGLIVTNYHVIEDATNIKVRGINGDFSTSLKAKVIVSDKNNDLAIIQILDDSFTNISKIPYTIKTSTTDVGENIFVLGYPLRSSMGDEIKLTNGIISSKTGFQGDITTYQISAPLQPGNSGGPLFNKFGNLIGIVNGKHIGAENVSYAIKVSYLKNLIDLLPRAPNFNTINSLANLSLSNQVKQLNKFVYIIEVN